MKVPLSDMTAQQFMEAAAAMGLEYKQLAIRLDRSPTQVSLYASGKRPIPVTIAHALGDLLKARAAELTRLSGQLFAEGAIGQMIAYTNQERQKREWSPDHRHHNALALKRRLHPQDHLMWEPMRIGADRALMLLRALADWRTECKRRIATELDTENLHRQYRLELAEVVVIAGHLPRTAPYEFVFSRGEWHVIARALCWQHKLDPKNSEYGKRYALYQFLRRHKGTGYPVSMMRARRREGTITPAQGAAL